MRVVLDTNVLLSAFFTRGVCEALLDACIAADAIEIVLSAHILDEFRKHAIEKFGAPRGDVREAIALLRRNADIIEPTQLPDDSCPDPDDIPVLGTAVGGSADALVTGDNELLAVTDFQGIPILSPREFYDRFK